MKPVKAKISKLLFIEFVESVGRLPTLLKSENNFTFGIPTSIRDKERNAERKKLFVVR